MIGGGLVHLGVRKIGVGSIQWPLFPRPATSATASVTTAAVFAHFAS